MAEMVGVYKVDNDCGEQEEMMAGEGRMCLFGMLLHPVKGVNMVVVEGGKTIEEDSEKIKQTIPDSEE